MTGLGMAIAMLIQVLRVLVSVSGEEQGTIPIAMQHTSTHKHNFIDCGGKVTTQKKIESPINCGNSNKSYHCNWVIKAPYGKIVAVTFIDMAMGHMRECRSDSVQIVDGRLPNNSSALPKRIIAVLCGHEEDQIHFPSGIYKSTGRTMTMVFNSTTMAGFVAKVEFTKPMHHNPMRCGISKHTPKVPRVVGGKPSRLHAWPWLVSLRYEDTGKHFCAGAILSKTWVLTAAHCLQHSRGFFVMAGAHSKMVGMAEAGRQYRNLSLIINHGEYIEIGDGPDLALVEVNKPFVFSHEVSAICMPTKDMAPGEKCVVAGWGDTHDKEYNKHLMQVSVPLIPLDVCKSRKVYGPHHIHEFEICGGHMQGGKDACKGDSGGPLNCERNGQVEVQGIVSWGENCSKKNRPGIYTKISHPDLLNWIKEQGAKFYTAKMDMELD